LGTLRAGLWYEWADTNRHQYPSDPANNWADQPLPKFNESFWTNSYQPFAEYEFHVTPSSTSRRAPSSPTTRLTCCTTPTTAQPWASSPATPTPPRPALPPLRTPAAFLPHCRRFDLNYRVLSNWSVYGQVSTGSVVPASATYDYLQTVQASTSTLPTLATPPKQQKNTTYQVGTVYKGQRITIDADMYHIRFQSGFSSTIDNTVGDVDFGDTIYYLQPSSISQGVEFESTLVLHPGLNLYLNGSAGNAYYHGSMNVGTLAAPYYERAPSGLWVAQTPSDTEMQGLTYQNHGFDLGIFNKRVGEERLDNGTYHNQAIVPPFSALDGYVNFTIRNHSLFDQTKIRLSGTNLLDAHNIQNDSLGGSPVTQLIPGTTYTDAFLTNGPTPINGADAPSLMAGRSFSVSVTFGFAPTERK
jgi:iron complex outermembrane receptor protein